MKNPALERALGLLGSDSSLAAGLGVTRQAVSNWRRQGWIPEKHLEIITKITGVPADDLSREGVRRKAAAPAPPSILVSHDELVKLTGYRRHAEQIRELKRQGFWRARQARGDGYVILERAHYEAVCAGMTGSGVRVRPEPEPVLQPYEPAVRRKRRP